MNGLNVAGSGLAQASQACAGTSPIRGTISTLASHALLMSSRCARAAPAHSRAPARGLAHPTPAGTLDWRARLAQAVLPTPLARHPMGHATCQIGVAGRSTGRCTLDRGGDAHSTYPSRGPTQHILEKRN